MTTTNSNVDELVTRYLDLEQRRASIVEEQDVIKNQLRQALDPGKHQYDAGTVTLSPNRRFDAALASEVLTRINPQLLQVCSKTVVDSATAKKVLPPAVYEQCMKESDALRVAIS